MTSDNASTARAAKTPRVSGLKFFLMRSPTMHIYHAIVTEPGITRSEIARTTGRARATIEREVVRLLDARLVLIEHKIGRTKLYRANPKHAYTRAYRTMCKNLGRPR